MKTHRRMLPDQNKTPQATLLIASLGLLLLLVGTFTLPFNQGLFSKLFNRPNSHASSAPYQFQDNFETGNLSKWDGSNIEQGNTLEVATAAAEEGNYGIHVATNPVTYNNDDAYVFKNINPTNELYLRARIKLVQNMSVEYHQNFMGAGNNASTSDVGAITGSLAIRSYSGGPANELFAMANQGSPIQDTGISLKTNQWYCAELHIADSGNTEHVQAWLDGTQVADQTMVTTPSPMSDIFLGVTGPKPISEYYFDDFVMEPSDQIGCGITQPFTGPNLSNGSPAGHLDQTTTSTTLSVTTDVAASCKYSTTPGIAYDSMANTFSSTGGTTHTTIVSGLSPGNSYAYFVRCKDNVTSAVNNTDYGISFYVGNDSVATSPLSLASTFQSISVYSPFANDQDQNASVKMEWKKSSDSAWNPGTEMTVDRRASIDAADGGIQTNPYVNQYRASVVGLTPNTSYDIRVTYTDPDGVTGTNPLISTITTRNNVYPLGSGNSYYVATTGLDSNPGTLAAPFQTIQKAANTVKAGDTVYIRGGTYHEQVNLTTSGTANNWITFMPYQNESVTIDAQNSLGYNINSADNISYIHIKGLHLLNATGDGMLFNLADFITLEDNDIEGFGNNGVRAGGGSGYSGGSNLVMLNNTIVRTSAPCTGCEGHLVSVWRNNGGNIYDHNTFKDLSGVARSAAYWDCLSGGSNYAFDGGPAPRDSDVSNNFFDDCNDDQLELDGGNMNSRVWGNTFKAVKNGFTAISTAPTLLGPVYIFRNVSFGHQESTNKEGNGDSGFKYFFNNTFYESTGIPDGVEQTNPGFSNFVSFNNVWQSGRYVLEGYEGGSTFKMDYDDLYTTDPTRFIKWNNDTGCCATFSNFKANTGQEAHGFSFDAGNEFVDPVNGDFHLKTTSQLIDKGVILPGFNDATSAWPYSGQAPDIGAFESGVVASPTPTINPTPLIEGDLNGDGHVNLTDLSIFSASYGLSGSAILNPAADINQDGVVNLTDLSLLASHYGT